MEMECIDSEFGDCAPVVKKPQQILDRLVIIEGMDRFTPRREVMVYVSGPYSASTWAERRIHVARAELVGVALMEAGYSVIVPHTMTQGWEGYPSLAYEDFIDQDLELVRRSDAICMVPGWRGSVGALKEKAQAECRKMPVFQALFQEEMVW